jgi:hypothetical protein
LAANIPDVVKTAPGAFQMLEAGIVEDLVDLSGEEQVDFRDEPGEFLFDGE